MDTADIDELTADITELKVKITQLKGSRELSLAITKLDECMLWLVYADQMEKQRDTSN